MQLDQLKRREFITLLGGATVLSPVASVAQHAAEGADRSARWLLAMPIRKSFGQYFGKGCEIWVRRREKHSI